MTDFPTALAAAAPQRAANPFLCLAQGSKPSSDLHLKSWDRVCSLICDALSFQNTINSSAAFDRVVASSLLIAWSIRRSGVQISLPNRTRVRYKRHSTVAINQPIFRTSSARPAFRVTWLFGLAVLLASCNRVPPTPARDYSVVNTYPHDRGAFTQGLLFLNGVLYESTGQYGQSSLRKVELKTGKVLQQVNVPDQYFAEGLALLDGKLYQLTWQDRVGFVYDLNTFNQEKQFFYPFEGWGLATDGKSLILSDGSDQIRFIEPLTFTVQRTINVRENGRPVADLNELEYIKGQIYANVWQTDRIVRIDPATGQVTRDYDLSGLLPPEDREPNTDVLNGIAYDPDGDHLYITGKLWPKLFEIKLKP